MSRRYILSQVVKTVFQCLLYVTLFLSFFLPLSVTNPQIINLSRTAATTMATFAIVLVILTYVYGGYQLGIKKARSVFSSVLIAVLFADVFTYLQLEIMNVNPAKNHQLILFGEDFWLFCSAIVLQVGLIYLFVWLGYHFYFKINPPQKCCIVTSSQEQAQHIAEKIATFRQKYKLCDVLHYECADVHQTILNHDVVFLAGIPDTEEAELKSFCYKYGKTMYLLAELEDVITSTSEQSVIDDTLFLYIHRVEPSLVQRFIKRASDIVISVLGLIVTSPLMLLAALLIFLSHNGPIFFRQKRATIGGRVFNIIKFRTMYRNACDTAGSSACENDERITRVGRVLRKYRIDELPQLFNVLAGDMSIVGPRPEMLENVDRYTQEVPEFEYRKQMKAGLTGMAQIDGKYNTAPKDKVILDLLYIENFSLMQDAKLILRTATIFFRRDSTEGFHARKQARCPQMRSAALAAPVAAESAAPAADTLKPSAVPYATPPDAPMPVAAGIAFVHENIARETLLEANEAFGTPSRKSEPVRDRASARMDGSADRSASGADGQTEAPAIKSTHEAANPDNPPPSAHMEASNGADPAGEENKSAFTLAPGEAEGVDPAFPFHSNDSSSIQPARSSNPLDPEADVDNGGADCMISGAQAAL
ncbi:MAG TPA: exopolysaccharide biosynthesis polyprenyl glycosylphosphotransferase [Candidatus Limiplasma sp.]|nr:exopolysaccharide biosynthesis polyprenyl glycosylphosphotransferase [Candidatus Limiplasma sp.]HPS80561.1 exopolysaccharide biosynthesis polyprenyl glycosylphosphotransferase [Candidatus Limiplasma sp.]